jgi:type II secretory pathway pseudopilin PulG
MEQGHSEGDARVRVRGVPGRPCRQRAMTLVEMTIVVFLVVVSLFLLIGWTGNLQQDAKQALAVRMLTDLDTALARYRRATGSYPASHGPDSAIQAAVYLLDHELEHDKARPLLVALPPSLWRGAGRRNLVDPWGTPLRYYSADSGSPFVKANNGRPVFVSAGPDCEFGDDDPSRLGDNLRSDDPGVEGFGLDQLMREPLTEEEHQNVQEDNRPAGGE